MIRLLTNDLYRDAKKYARSIDQPAPTITGSAPHNRVWIGEEVRHLAQAGSASTVVDPRPITRPAAVITGGGNAEWTERPGRAQKHNDRAADAQRVTPEEAAALQSYPDGFTFAGAKTKRYLQIGNAVPPLLARAVLEALWAPIIDETDEYGLAA